MKTRWVVLGVIKVFFLTNFVLAAAYPEPFPMQDYIAQKANTLEFEVESDLLKASAVKSSAYCTLGGLIGCALK